MYVYLLYLLLLLCIVQCSKGELRFKITGQPQSSQHFIGSMYKWLSNCMLNDEYWPEHKDVEENNSNKHIADKPAIPSRSEAVTWFF